MLIYEIFHLPPGTPASELALALNWNAFKMEIRAASWRETRRERQYIYDILSDHHKAKCAQRIPNIHGIVLLLLDHKPFGITVKPGRAARELIFGEY